MGADERALLEVGRIVKAHGLKGQVAVDMWSDRAERMAPGATLETDRGTLHVDSAIENQPQRYLVHFAEIDDRNAAERWRGVILRAALLEIPDVLWIDQFFGATCQSTDGVVRGTVVSVEENPASDLLILDTGAMVPLSFVVSLVPHDLVVVQVPEGLFE